MVLSRPRGWGVTLAAALVALAVLAPLLWVVSVSFMAPGEAAQAPAPLLPERPTLFEYDHLFRDYAIARPMLNSLVVALLSTAGCLALTVPAGYALAKLRFRGRATTLAALVTLLVIPWQLSMLPLFLLLKEVGLLNTFAGATVPWLANIFAVLLMRQAALAIPDEMLDAARIDGASEWQVFARVAVPLLRPMIATLAISTFLGSWNDFIWPLVELSDDRLYTLPVALAALSREHMQDGELMMAGAVVTMVPVLLVFLPLQRFYIGGLLGGAIKG